MPTNRRPAPGEVGRPVLAGSDADRLVQETGQRRQLASGKEVPKTGPEGKLDFHACRTAFINLVLDSGVSVKDAQELARHSTVDLILNVYGRAREDRMAEAVERIGMQVLSRAPRQECAICVLKLETGSEAENAIPWASEDCVSCELVAAEGIEPPTRGL